MFALQCTHKGCYKFQHPVLDLETNEIHCSDCDGVLTNVSPFIKQQLKIEKQIRKRAKKPKHFAVKCSVCSEFETPKVKDNELMCGACDAELQVTTFFKNLALASLNVKGSD